MNIDVLGILNYFQTHSFSSIPYCMQIASLNSDVHMAIIGGTHAKESGRA